MVDKICPCGKFWRAQLSFIFYLATFQRMSSLLLLLFDSFLFFQSMLCSSLCSFLTPSHSPYNQVPVGIISAVQNYNSNHLILNYSFHSPPTDNTNQLHYTLPKMIMMPNTHLLLKIPYSNPRYSP